MLNRFVGKMRKFATPILLAIALLSWSIAVKALAFENRECLDCHGDPKLVQVLGSGELRSIFVDPSLWEGDVHNQKGIKCMDCHSQASPRSHPRKGLVEADCTRCHPEDSAAFLATTHARMEGLTDRALPQCYDCHTAHAVRKKEDPKSTVHVNQIKETCRECHPEIMPGGVLNRLALFRISGHRKEDVSKKFDMRVCILCHQEGAAHGQARIYHGMCNDCHMPRVKTAMLGMHLIPVLREQPVTFALKYLDGILALSVLLAIAVFFAGRYRQNLPSLLRGKPKEE